MHIQRSRERMLTTHCGSLARPTDLLDLMKLKVNDQPYDQDIYTKRVQSAVAKIVRKQIETGIDIITDGEQSKAGFFTYVNERLTGFAPKPGARLSMFADETAAFPEHCVVAKNRRKPNYLSRHSIMRCAESRQRKFASTLATVSMKGHVFTMRS